MCCCLIGQIAFSNLASAQIDAWHFPQIQPDASQADIDNFLAALKKLIKDPKLLDNLSPQEIAVILGRVGDKYLDDMKNKLPPEEVADLRKSQTMVIGLAIASLESRVDPTITQTNYVFIPRLYPYEDFAKPEDINNDVKRKAYIDAVTINIKRAEHINEQIELREYLDPILQQKRDALSLLYANNPSLIPEELLILKQSGLNENIINALTKP
jgi:hypothetical protein